MPDSQPWKELLPPEGDPKVGEEAAKILAEVIQDKETLGLRKKWMRNYELRKNKHWKQTSSGVNLVTANLIYTHMQRTVNVMTDNDPTFNLVAMGETEGQEELYDNLQKAAESWWIDTEQSDEFARTVTNGENYGICIEKNIFNPDLESGIGEAETIVVDPMYFGVYPPKMTDPKRLQQADAVLHYYPLTVREIKRRWGDKAKEAKPDQDLIKELGDTRREVAAGSGPGMMLVSLSSAIKTILNWGGKDSKEQEETLVCEIWLRDYSDETKYPGNIRCVTFCNGGKIVLEDRPNPSISIKLWDEQPEEAAKTYLFDKYPFSAANPIIDTSNFWGCCDLEQIEQLQVEINKALSQFLLMKDKAARQKILNPLTSGVQNHEFTNSSGVINPVNSQEAAAIKYLGALESNIDIEKSIQILKDLFFLVAGTFELDQAQVQGREVIAYKAIAALMERAATMMRGKIRAYNRMIRERGRMYLSHVMNFYTEERWIQYNDAKTGKTMAKQIPPGVKMIIPAKLTVVSGSTLPVSRVQRREEAIALSDKGQIDQQALLEALDWPNRNDIVQRMHLGVLGQGLQKLQGMQIPPEIIDVLGQVMSLEDKEYEKLMKQGEIPTIQDIMTMLTQGQGMPAEPGKQAEQAEAQAKAEKMSAEAALIAEKILTERVKQQQILKGIEFDEDMLQMERAKIVSELEHAAKASERDDFKTGVEAAKVVTASKNQPGYNEKGMKSNNLQA